MKKTIAWFDGILAMLDGETIIGICSDGANGDWFQINDKKIINVISPDDDDPAYSYQLYDEFYVATSKQKASLGNLFPDDLHQQFKSDGYQPSKGFPGIYKHPEQSGFMMFLDNGRIVTPSSTEDWKA